MKSVTQLLQSAGLALKALASSKENASTPLSERRETFQTTTNAYFETLQTIDVGLQRQLLGLEEADIIPAGKKEAQDVAANEQLVQGRLGHLDIGWLNSRSAIVDRNVETELWEKARLFLEDLKVGKDGKPGKLQEADSDDIDMVV